VTQPLRILIHSNKSNVISRDGSFFFQKLDSPSSCITSSSVTISIILPNTPSHPKHSTVTKQATTNEYISPKRSKAYDCLKWHSCDQRVRSFKICTNQSNKTPVCYFCLDFLVNWRYKRLRRPKILEESSSCLLVILVL
jgi:hypothetical protein